MESCNKNAAIVMAIEMKVAASWPVVLLASWAIWPVGLLVTSIKFACNRSCLCTACVCVLKAAASFTSHTRTHTKKKSGN